MRAIRRNLRDVIAILALAVVGIASLLVILASQKAALPSWVPILGQDFYELKADFSSAQAVIPGQGQAVDIAGIQAGKVSGVTLEDGHAVVKMDVEPKYAKLIHSDAQLLLRPKTGLNDMVVEVDPGTRGDTPPEGSTIPLAQTQPNVSPDEILAVVDADTREFLTTLLSAGARGLGGQGRQLSAGLRRFEPLSRDLAKLGRALAKRRDNIRRAVHNFRLVAQELGAHDVELARFVDSANAVFESFARRQDSLRQILRELPPTLDAAQTNLAKADQLSLVLRPAALRLIPPSRNLKASLEASQKLFRRTLVPLRDQIRPFTRQVRPTVRHLAQASAPLEASATGLRKSTTDLNVALNELAYNPPGAKDEGFLFFLPWLNHDLSSIFLTQDAEGPVRRSILIFSCNTVKLAEDAALANALLKTELQATQVPTSEEICPDVLTP